MHWAYGALASLVLLGSMGAEMVHTSTTSFDLQRTRLKAAWQRDVREGLPAKDLAPVTAELGALAAQHWGPVPGRWIPNFLSAAVKVLNTETTTVMAHYTNMVTAKAASALARLNQVEGQFAASRQPSRKIELQQAATPKALTQLTSRWSADAAQFQGQAAALAALGGPEEDGLPADVAHDVASLSSAEAQAQQLGVSTRPAADPLEDVATYRGQPPGAQLSQLSSLESDLTEATAQLTSAVAEARAQLSPRGMRALPAAIQDYLDGRQGDVAVSVYDAVTQQSFSINGSALFDTASIIKVPILATLLQQAQANHTSLTTAQQNLATPMIEDSSNSDATALWNAEGGAPAVAAFVHGLGMNNTTPNAYWGLTTTTAPDQVKLLSALAYGTQALSAASVSYELSLMEHVTSWEAWGVTGGVPNGVTVALKNGWLPRPSGWVINSIGWVSGQGRNYVIAILTNQDPGEQYGIDTANTVSGLVWNALAR